MFKLKKENEIYYLYYKPTKFVICSPTIQGALRHLMLIQSILAGQSEQASRQMRQFNMSGKTMIGLMQGLYQIRDKNNLPDELVLRAASLGLLISEHNSVEEVERAIIKAERERDRKVEA